MQSTYAIHTSIDDGNVPSSTLLLSDVDYGLPPYAKQANNHSFWTNDARPLGAVKIGDEIQFVGNSINHENGLAGIYHGIIEDVNNPTLKGNVISDDVLEFGFPNIVAMGKFKKSKINKLYNYTTTHLNYFVFFLNNNGVSLLFRTKYFCCPPAL